MIESYEKVGLSSCPQDAAPEIKAIADYISHINGGQGCVRDVIEQTLKVQGNGQTNRFFQTYKNKKSFNYCLSQYLIRYAIIIPMTDSKSLSDIQFFYLVISTIFIAAAGLS